MGGRRDEEGSERPPAQQNRVAGAVQGHAAGKAEVIAGAQTVQVMQHFSFTLGQWMNLGLMQEHVRVMETDGVSRVFDMPKDEVIEVISNYRF